jgi:branched-chain amino acid transport system substrate-binding protein
MANALFRGFSLWQEDINRAGGLLGRPVQVLFKDDRSDPELARDLYRTFINTHDVNYLFAPYSSLITEAVLPIAEANQVPILIAGAAADRLWEKGYRQAVGIYTPASKFSVGFLELLVLQGLDGIAVVYAEDPFSVDLAKSTEKWIRRLGLKQILYKGFKKGTKDLGPLAKTARERGADVLMVCGHMQEAVSMTRSLHRLNWRPKAFYASLGPALHSFYDQCGKQAERVFATSLWEPRANYPGARKFEQTYIKAYGNKPGYHAGDERK